MTTKDETYILDLCDEILNRTSQRQYRFSFLLGDPGKNGSCRKLPVDAYYENLNLVIEYKERQHTESVNHLLLVEFIEGFKEPCTTTVGEKFCLNIKLNL